MKKKPEFVAATCPKCGGRLELDVNFEVAYCADCGLSIYYEEFEVYDGCTRNTTGTYVFTYNGIDYVFGYEYLRTNHNGTYSSLIYVSEYGACGGYIEVYRCYNCDEITEIGNIYVDCDINLDPDPTYYEDEKGFTHELYQTVFI